MIDAEIVYRAEAFHGDVLRAEVGLGALSSHGCEIFTRLRASSGGDVAVARTGFAFFDYQSRKVVAVPAVFRARVESGATPERA
jgi:4-hydroxybenzoyl-CoA thioesterase